MNRVLIRLAPLVLMLLLSGCARSPRVSFYTLSPGALPAAEAKPAGPSVSVGPVTLPELVDRPQLVLRTGENRVELLETHRWAEPLKSEVPRFLARSIGRMLGSDRVSSYGQSSGADATYRVLVDIVRLDSVPGDSVTLEALWSVRRAGGAKRGGRTLVQEKVSGAGYDALVAACGRALTVLSGDIARTVQAEAAVTP